MIMRDNVIQSIRTVYLNPDLLLSEKYSINRINQRFIPRREKNQCQFVNGTSLPSIDRHNGERNFSLKITYPPRPAILKQTR